MNDKIKVLIDEETIQQRINELAIEISKDYKNEEIVLICILKGSTYFAIDLSKKLINNDVILDFMKVSSYGNNLESTGNINFNLDTSIDIKNKFVVGYGLDFDEKYRNLSYIGYIGD